jgi:hypothetical protein
VRCNRRLHLSLNSGSSPPVHPLYRSGRKIPRRRLRQAPQGRLPLSTQPGITATEDDAVARDRRGSNAPSATPPSIPVTTRILALAAEAPPATLRACWPTLSHSTFDSVPQQRAAACPRAKPARTSRLRQSPGAVTRPATLFPPTPVPSRLLRARPRTTAGVAPALVSRPPSSIAASPQGPPQLERSPEIQP